MIYTLETHGLATTTTEEQTLRILLFAYSN